MASSAKLDHEDVSPVMQIRPRWSAIIAANHRAGQAVPVATSTCRTNMRRPHPLLKHATRSATRQGMKHTRQTNRRSRPATRSILLLQQSTVAVARASVLHIYSSSSSSSAISRASRSRSLSRSRPRASRVFPSGRERSPPARSARLLAPGAPPPRPPAAEPPCLPLAVAVPLVATGAAVAAVRGRFSTTSSLQAPGCSSELLLSEWRCRLAACSSSLSACRRPPPLR